jgi:hypothetical protein
MCLLLLLLLQVMASRLWSMLSRYVHYDDQTHGRYSSSNTHSDRVQQQLRKQQQEVSKPINHAPVPFSTSSQDCKKPSFIRLTCTTLIFVAIYRTLNKSYWMLTAPAAITLCRGNPRSD